MELVSRMTGDTLHLVVGKNIVGVYTKEKMDDFSSEVLSNVSICLLAVQRFTDFTPSLEDHALYSADGGSDGDGDCEDDGVSISKKH
nr:hypothetical protein [Tanacetum cinerariifolium]